MARSLTVTSETSMAGRLVGPKLWAARTAWVALVVAALALWAVSTVQFVSDPVPLAAETEDPTVFTREDIDVLRQMGLPDLLATAPVVFFLLLNVVYFAMGGWIFWRRSDQWMALLVSLALVVLGAIPFSYSFDVVYRDYPQWVPLMNTLLLLGVVSLAYLLYAFPDGRFVPSWTRFLPVALSGLLLPFVLPLPEGLQGAAGLAAMVGLSATGAYARAYRYRYRSSPLERQQAKWVGFGLIGLAVGMGFWFLMYAFPQEQPGPTRIYVLIASLSLGAAVILLFPISVAMAVLRHRLWEIDILLNRTVVYGPLTGILMGLYVGSIRFFQALFVQFTGGQSDLSILLSTLLLAGAFMPLRTRLQSLADRYLKDAPDPSKALRVLGEQMRSLAQLADVGQLTRRLLDEAVAAFHAESGAVVLREGEATLLVQTTGAWSGRAQVSVPLEHAGVRIGELSLGPRHRGQEYTPQEREILQEIAGGAAQALALSLSLHASS